MDQPLPEWVAGMTLGGRIWRGRAAIAFAAGLATSGCNLKNNQFRPHFAGPEPVMRRLASAAHQCGFREVHIGPPLIRSTPDQIGLRIEWMGRGRPTDCLLQWSRENGVDVIQYRIIYDRAPGESDQGRR